MKTTQQLTALLTAATLATSALAQPTLTTKVSNIDLAGTGFVYSETPVVKTKASLDGKAGYISYERAAQTEEPTKFFYDYAAIGKSFDTRYANVAVELASVNVGGFGRTNELWTKVTAKAPLSPSLEFAVDAGAENGRYAAFGISQSGNVGGIDLSADASVTYNHNLSRDMSGLSHAQLGITASKQLTPKLSVSASARLQKAIHATFKNAQMYQAAASYKF